MPHLLRLTAIVCLLWTGNETLSPPNGNAAKADEERPAFRPDMPLNTWVKVEPKYLPFPGGGRHRPQSWNKLVYDPVGKRLLYMDRWTDEEHGHSIYANAVLAFDPVANEVDCLKLSHWKVRSREGGGYDTVALPANKKEPTPGDRHPYGNLTFVPVQNALYLSAGANRSALDGDRRGHAITSDTWRFDVGQRKWSRIDDADSKPPRGLEDAMCYDAAHKVIVRICRGYATWLLDVETGKWRDAQAENNPKSGMAAAMCYDSKRERVMVFGGGGKDGADWNTPHSECYAYSVKDKQWTRLADVPVPVRSMGAAYDSKRDVVLIHSGRGRYPFFFGFYDPDKNEWRKLDLPEAAPLPSPAWHTLAYDAAHDVYVRAAAEGGNPEWWLFRPDFSKADAVEREGISE